MPLCPSHGACAAKFAMPAAARDRVPHAKPDLRQPSPQRLISNVASAMPSVRQGSVWGAYIRLAYPLANPPFFRAGLIRHRLVSCPRRTRCAYMSLNVIMLAFPSQETPRISDAAFLPLLPLPARRVRLRRFRCTDRARQLHVARRRAVRRRPGRRSEPQRRHRGVEARSQVGRAHSRRPGLNVLTQALSQL